MQRSSSPKTTDQSDLAVWVRNLVFVGLCFVGIGALAANLLSRQRIEDPLDFDPGRYQSTEFRKIVTQVNGEFHRHWQDADVVPAPRANGMLLARRLSLALTGTIPSLEEIRAWQYVPDEQRLGWWLDRLLEDRRFSDYLAERLARAYVGVEEGPFLIYRRRRFVSWLSDRLHENMAYDELVRQLISDSGLWTDSPAVNFVTVTVTQDEEGHPDEVKLAGRTARAFLGVRLDCMQCHDDHLEGSWRQSDFHQLAAYYSEARSSLLGIQDKQREYEYQYLGKEQVERVPPSVPFAQRLDGGEGSRRERLADWVTHRENMAFARAIVNRVWALMFGKPLVESVDNIPLEGPYPPGLETLAHEFTQHDYDLRHLIRVIAWTDVFQRDSRADHEITLAHEQVLAAFLLTRLRPEQVAGALNQASTFKTVDAHAHIVLRTVRTIQQNDFIRRYGDTGEDEFGAHGGTIPQRLLMMNGELVSERTQDDLLNNSATRIARLVHDDHQATKALYLTVLTRDPSDHELAHFRKRLENSADQQRRQKLEDLCWVLLNSAEFS